MATIARKAPKYLPAGRERLATVVPWLRRCRRPAPRRASPAPAGARARPPAGRAGSPGIRAVDAVGADHGLPDLEDRRPREGGDDARRDLEIDRGVPQSRDGAVQSAGGHDRGPDGQGRLHRLGLGLHALALPGGQHEQHDRQKSENEDRKVLLHDRCASLPRVQLRGGCGPGWDRSGASVVWVALVHGARGRPNGTRAAAAGRVARQRPRVYASKRGSDDVPGVDGAPPTPPAMPPSSAPPRGRGCPRWCQAASVATRPRGVRASSPARTRNGSQTSSTVLGSSPTVTASVATPTGPPPKRTTRASSTARSSRSRPRTSTS